LPDGLETFPFRDDRLVLVVPRGDLLSGSRQRQLADVVARDFVGLPRESALQRHIAGHAARLGATMKVRARVTGFDAVCRMVESGVGVAIVPETAARRCRRAMKIDVIGLRDAWARRRLAVCVRRLQALPVGARHLVERLRSVDGTRR
jgi:DNA-binding transcriptional LysR family regulator